ncbi:hypothetical protein GE09DRAFT_1253708 [Coniochaeta sp. 2T2.1]|nr:hypothetical protein GE09DRAFT_1253708 [Coniochaeta sp. 2T2.1]
MDTIVVEFIRTLRSSFCNLVIANVPGVIALATRGVYNTWVGKEFRYTGRASLKDFDPKCMGPIIFNTNTEIAAAENALAVFQDLIVWLSMTMAHECAHVFTAFLHRAHGGDPRRCVTPEGLYYFPSSKTYPCKPDKVSQMTDRPRKGSGEAGWVFEFLAFGGKLKDRFRDSARFQGNGIEFQFEENGEVKDRHVPHEVLEDFIRDPERQVILTWCFRDFDLARLHGKETTVLRVTDASKIPDGPWLQPEDRARSGLNDISDKLKSAEQIARYRREIQYMIEGPVIENFTKDPVHNIVSVAETPKRG